MPRSRPALNLEQEYNDTVRDLFRRAQKARPDHAFLEFLDFMRRFNRFSLFNNMLIYAQKPGAAVVASLTQWKDIGREVKPDALPIVVLQPFAPVQFLYDLSDTTGDAVPGEAASPLLATGKAPDATWERTLARCEELGVIVEKISHGPCLAGTAAELKSHRDLIDATGAGKNCVWRVRINGHLDGASKFATLAHELGHVYCGHFGGHPKNYWRERRYVPLSMREIEAETVSYLVCSRSGITTRSAQYLHDYITEYRASDLDIPAIIRAADLVEARALPAAQRNKVGKAPQKLKGQMSMFEERQLST